jgi:hypothetical protein
VEQQDTFGSQAVKHKCDGMYCRGLTTALSGVHADV